MKVHRCEQHNVEKTHELYKIIDQYCFYSKNVYNEANYIMRQEYIVNHKILSAFDIEKKMQLMDCYKECGSQAAQKTIQMLCNNWKSFIKANKDYTKYPDKYLGKPKIPKYLDKNGRYVFSLKNIQCSVNNGIFRISFKPFKQYTIKTRVTGKLIQCRFIPKGSHYTMEIVYEIDVPECLPYPDRIAAIDVGVDNFITMVNNMGEDPIAVKGGVIKSINQYYNKQKAKIQSELKKKNNLNWSKRLQKLSDKRFEKIKYQMHCISKYVTDYCVLYDIDTLIVGHNDQWKQENKGMQNFTYIPYDMFFKMLQYKCENNGIRYITVDESYTSGTSFLDEEDPMKENYNKNRRIHRGLFRSNKGEYINADVNGAYQILKKVVPDAFANGIEGAGLHPTIIKIA